MLRWLADVAILGVSHRLPGLVLKIDCFSLVIGQSWLPAAEGLADVEHGLMRVVQQSRQVAQLVRERLGRRLSRHPFWFLTFSGTL